MDKNKVVEQSKAAYNQFKIQWRENAKIHSRLKMKSFIDFENIGIGKPILAVANGYTFEENLKTIKEHKDVDILCCDKTLGHLLDNGISPKYCMVCDANVDYEKYMEKYKDQLQDTILFITVTANTQWSLNGNWKDIYLFCNEDSIGSHKEFMNISKCPNLIPAATNVSNQMIVLLTQCDNTRRSNFFGYDKILLIGYDYSWRYGGKYYSFDESGDMKHNYMRHVYAKNIKGDPCYSSSNLLFSAQWLEKYIKTFRLPVVQCSDESLIIFGHSGKLEEQLKYSFHPEHSDLVKKMLAERFQLQKKITEIDKHSTYLFKEHQKEFIKTTL